MSSDWKYDISLTMPRITEIKLDYRLFPWNTVLNMDTKIIMSVEKLTYALKFLVAEASLAPALASVLEKCCRQSGIRFHEIKTMTGEAAEELLLLAWDWKLLLPRRSGQCAEWDDRIMRFEAGEYYGAPNIIEFLVESAAATGNWNLEAAIRSLYAHMGEPAYDKMPLLVKEITQLTKNLCISAASLHSACIRAGLKNRTDAMIAILKGGGIMSPKLKSGGPTAKAGSPVYEVHPAVIELFNKNRRCINEREFLEKS